MCPEIRINEIHVGVEPLEEASSPELIGDAVSGMKAVKHEGTVFPRGFEVVKVRGRKKTTKIKQTPRPILDKVEGDAERKKGPWILRPITSLSGSGELFRSTVFLCPTLISLIHPSSPLAL